MKTTVLAVSFALLATTLPADTAGDLEKAWKAILDKGSSKEVMDALAAPDAAYRAEIEALEGEVLLKREDELRRLEALAVSLGETGAKKVWTADLRALDVIRGALGEINRIKAKVPATVKCLRLSGPVRLAKPARWDAGAPHFNGADRYGTTPGREFLHPLAVRGSRTGLKFSVRGALPEGVSLDTARGVLAGRPVRAGEYRLTVVAENAEGHAERPFTLVVGDNARGQTPLMGWTSWNAILTSADQKRISAAAHALVDRGFAARGYTYVNIDSTWQGLRDGKDTTALQPNRSRFPDMAGLVREIHGLGLKAGIYSTPMVIAWASDNCKVGYMPGSTSHPIDTRFVANHWGGCGLTRHEKADAAQWAAWGFDYLKYDWTMCDIEHARDMRAALDATDRDFTLCLCTGAQPDLADEYPKYAQLVRGAADTFDDWHLISHGCLYAAELWSAKCGRGCWYDLDMLSLGVMTLAREVPPTEPLDPKYLNRLTRDEQIAHFALWAFLPSPLQLSWDLAFTDDFTADLVSNEELIALNQDSAPRSAVTGQRTRNGAWVWTRRLADGSEARLFLNFDDKPTSFTWPLGRMERVRDVLANADLGAADGLEIELPPHAVRVIRGTKL